MQEEGTVTTQSELAPAPVIQHSYFEVASDVLAKPNALCDVLEVNGCPSSAIFCNSPSDADLVDVILKKRGINGIKLVGHVPPMRVSKALKQIKSGEAHCIIVTDVSGQTLDVEDLELVINYSLPSLPEVYIHRCGQSRPGAKLARVMSLISALDIANLHYLRKVVEFEITKSELPAKEQLLNSTFNKLKTAATESASMNDERLKVMAQQVLSDAAKEDILCMLLRNTLDVLPSLQTAAANVGGSEERSEYNDRRPERRDDGGQFREDRGGRGDNRGARDDRGGRGGRDDRRGGRNGRGGRDDRRFDNRGPRDGAPREGAPRGEGNDEQFGNQGGFEGRGGEFNENDGGEFRNRREPRQRMAPAEKTARVYIDQGKAHGFSSEKVTELVTSQCSLPADAVKAVSVRENYSFADFPEEQVEGIVQALNEMAVKQGGKAFARKAVTLSSSRLPAEGGHRERDSYESDSGRSNTDSNDGDSGDNEQPDVMA